MKEEVKNLGYLEGLDPVELVAYPTILILILIWAWRKGKQRSLTEPDYKYFFIGVLAKILGASAFCAVYTYYYKGGDTIAYYESARAYVNLLFEDPTSFWTAYTHGAVEENMYLFKSTTGYPWGYMFMDPKTNLLIRVITPFVLLGMNGYLLSSIFFSLACFAGTWKLYRLFCNYYPDYRKYLAITILLFPSAVFWGSGMLKDTLTFSSVCWLVVGFESFFIRKKRSISNILILVFSFLLLLLIKPYFIIAVIPGCIIWNFYDRILKIKNTLIRVSAIPFILVFSSVLGYVVLVNAIGFSIDSLLEEAVVKQADLKREEYNGNSFDIGTYEPTLQGASTVAVPAMVAGLFRPFLWEAKNVVMIFSGMENFFVLVLLILVLFRVRVIGFFSLVFRHPIVMFCLFYTLIFSLIVGLSTSNFGALVRFKIAFLPFFTSALLIMFFEASRKKSASRILRDKH